MPYPGLRPLTESESINELWRLVRQLSAQVGTHAVNGYRDRYTISNTATTDYVLTFVPRANTVNLFLNGLALDEGIDYTVDYATPQIILTSSATRVVGQILWARYLTASPVSTSSGANLWRIVSNAAHSAVPGDAGVAYLPTTASDVQADFTLSAGAACDVAVILIDPVANNRLIAQIANYSSNTLHLFKTVAGVDTNFSPIVEANPTISNGTHTLRLTLSGTTATVYLDGVSTLTHTLTSGEAAMFASAKPGLRATGQNDPAIDNFTVAGVLADNFNRADTPSGLGTASGGLVWGYM